MMPTYTIIIDLAMKEEIAEAIANVERQLNLIGHHAVVDVTLDRSKEELTPKGWRTTLNQLRKANRNLYDIVHYHTQKMIRDRIDLPDESR